MEILIEYALEIVSALAVMLIGVAGTYLTVKASQRAELENTAHAIEQVTKAAQMAVGELQQTVVTGWKEAGGGKLNEAQIKELGRMLQYKARELLSPSVTGLLEAAKIDVTALITAAGEDWIRQIK